MGSSAIDVHGNGFNIDNAARTEKRQDVDCRVGRINTAALAEEIISQDKSDMVVMEGRSQIRNSRIRHEGRIGDIVHCVDVIRLL